MKKHKMKRILPFVGATIIMISGAFVAKNSIKIFDDIENDTTYTEVMETKEESDSLTIETSTTKEKTTKYYRIEREDSLGDYLENLSKVYSQVSNNNEISLPEIVSSNTGNLEVISSCCFEAMKQVNMSKYSQKELLDTALVIELYDMDINPDIYYDFQSIADELCLSVEDTILYIQNYAYEYHLRVCDDEHYNGYICEPLQMLEEYYAHLNENQDKLTM